MKYSQYLALFMFFLGCFFLLFEEVCYANNIRLKPLDVYSIHLYVTSSTVAKADSAFATKHFMKISKLGKFKPKMNRITFKNRPQFQYVRGYAMINGGKKRRVNWRYRGLMKPHWQEVFPYRSIKIRFLDKNEDLAFSTLNLNHFATDPMLNDMICHEIYQLYDCITPRMKLVKFYVNDQYAGFKVLVEEIDDEFLEVNGLPKGNIYRENRSFATIGVKVISGVNYYKYWWRKKSLNKQKNWDDWMHLNQLLSLGCQEVGEYLLDKEYYIKWLALGVFMPIWHMDNHNLYLYHNLKNQKWYSLPWDMTTDFYGETQEEFLLVAPNKVYKSVLQNPYNYHKRNQQLWTLLADDEFFNKVLEAANSVYRDYVKEIEFCIDNLKAYKETSFNALSIQKITSLVEQLPLLITQRRDMLKQFLQSLPEIETVFNGNKIIIEGKSLVGFKINKNGWTIKKYENLTMLQNSKNESCFLINFINALAEKTERYIQLLQPKPFYIELELPKNAHNKFKPQIASLFSSNYKTLKPDVFSKKPDELPIRTDEQKTVPRTDFSNAIVSKLLNFWNKLKNADLFYKLNDKKTVNVYLEQVVLLLDKLRKRDYLEENKVIHWSGEKILHRTTVVPSNSTLILDSGTILRLGKKVSLVIEGDFIVKGTAENKVRITSISKAPHPSDHWGSICFIHSLSQKSGMEHCIMEYGSEEHIKGIYFRGALSAYNIPFYLENCEFRYNIGDDAANFKYSLVTVKNCKFHHNRADAIDLDFANGKIQNSDFYLNGNDGIDCGTSISEIYSNIFSKQMDKAISVGEESDVKLNKNIFFKNNLGIAIKDGSMADMRKNVFLNNEYAIKSYIKKRKYDKPRYDLEQNYVFNNNYNLYDDFPIEKHNLDKRCLLILESQDQVEKILENNFSKDTFHRFNQHKIDLGG
ncbi:MAG: CotH kinase family protein [Candidatus Omnitrophota bacterium]